MSLGILEGIQTDCANQLIASPLFASIPVLSEYRTDVQFELEKALQGGQAIVAIVDTPDASGAFPDVGKPYWDNVSIRCTIFELWTQNQYLGGPSALQLAESVCVAWWQFRPQNLYNNLVPDRPTISSTEVTQDGLLKKVEVRYHTQTGLQYAFPVFDTPAFSQAGGSITISCNTISGTLVPGAATFYTTATPPATPANPAPFNVNSTANNLYTGPFSVASGTLIRCATWLPGAKTAFAQFTAS